MSLIYLILWAVVLIGMAAVSAWYGASWRAVAKGFDDAAKVRSRRPQEKLRGAGQVAADPSPEPAVNASTAAAGPPSPGPSPRAP